MPIITWCGEESVVLYYNKCQLEKNIDKDLIADESLLILVHAYGNYEIFKYDSSLALVQEIDCCRIYSPTGMQILEPVNKYLQGRFYHIKKRDF
jgi:hypothetical protein